MSGIARGKIILDIATIRGYNVAGSDTNGNIIKKRSASGAGTPEA